VESVVKSVSCVLGLWALSFLGIGAPALAGPGPSASQNDARPASQSLAAQSGAAVSGRVMDPTGVGVVGAAVKLSNGNPGATQQAVTDSDGRFVFTHAEPGPVHLTITAAGFAAQEFSGTIFLGQTLQVPPITLPLATVNTEVRVVPPQVIAEAQIKEQEKQKALGFIPNYYVSYVPNAMPLAPKQKFELAWKTMLDPVTFGITGVVAGIQQAQNDFSGYGQGADGYAKRYGAAYADAAIGTMIGGAILPSLFKQDPRYFYKGTGSKKSRLMYAIANSVICKGDNGHWQANYSGILGGLAAGGISNLYYPAKDRDAGLVFQNALIGIGATAAANILQEFVVRKLTPNLPAHDPASGNTSGGGKTHTLVGRALGSLGSLVREGD
jgi:Carboxypeptidase regulatory-like domain